jgi:hypothetical protein
MSHGVIRREMPSRLTDRAESFRSPEHMPMAHLARPHKLSLGPSRAGLFRPLALLRFKMAFTMSSTKINGKTPARRYATSQQSP